MNKATNKEKVINGLRLHLEGLIGDLEELSNEIVDEDATLKNSIKNRLGLAKEYADGMLRSYSAKTSLLGDFYTQYEILKLRLK